MAPLRNNPQWEATRRAANAAALAVASFLTLFVFSAEIPAVRAHSPWADDPYDAVVSFAALLIPLVSTAPSLGAGSIISRDAVGFSLRHGNPGVFAMNAS